MRFTIVIHILSISRALYKAITPAINFSVDLIVVWNDVRKKVEIHSPASLSPCIRCYTVLCRRITKRVDVRAEWLNYIATYRIHSQSDGLNTHYVRFYFFHSPEEIHPIVPYRKLHSFFLALKMVASDNFSRKKTCDDECRHRCSIVSSNVAFQQKY